MNTDWQTAIAFVLAAEGGYTFDPKDHGGETNFGISKRRYPNLNIKDLTKEEAMALYQKDFWEFCHCDELPSPLAIAVFDAAVNQGEGAAIRMLQVALGSVEVDGLVGDKTISAAFKSGKGTLRRFLAQRMARYARTIMKDPTQDEFTLNWSDRLMRLAELVFVKGPGA
jgi:lysozyme family protein